MNGYLKAIVQILVVVGICFSVFFWFGTTFATKDFVLSGFSEFQQTMSLERLIFIRDGLALQERDIRIWLYNHPGDPVALQDLEDVRLKIYNIDSKIEELTCPRR